MHTHTAPTMRAKMKISRIEKFEGGERLYLSAVCPKNSYPADGSDEDNTYAKFTPSAELNMYISNPALHGKFTAGDVYYLDFTIAEAAASAPAPVSIPAEDGQP